MSQLKKLMDLFVEGEVLPLITPSNKQVVVWVNKLTPFQAEQAAHEGRVARARTILALKEIGTPETLMFDAQAAQMQPAGLIEAICETHAMEWILQAIRDIRSDPKWSERVEVLEWSEDQLAGKSDDDPEVQIFSKINAEYADEMEKRQNQMRNDMRRELRDLTDDELRDIYKQKYLDERGMESFTREYNKQRVFLGMRECKATLSPDTIWDHRACDHTVQMLDGPEEVTKLPDVIFNKVRDTLSRLEMSQDTARFSEGPASSSASSGPASSAEASTPSTPEETSSAQA